MEDLDISTYALLYIDCSSFGVRLLIKLSADFDEPSLDESGLPAANIILIYFDSSAGFLLLNSFPIFMAALVAGEWTSVSFGVEDDGGAA